MLAAESEALARQLAPVPLAEANRTLNKIKFQGEFDPDRSSHTPNTSVNRGTEVQGGANPGWAEPSRFKELGGFQECSTLQL